MLRLIGNTTKPVAMSGYPIAMLAALRQCFIRRDFNKKSEQPVSMTLEYWAT